MRRSCQISAPRRIDDEQVGELGLVDDELGHGALVVGDAGELGSVGDVARPGGVRQPRAGVDGRDDPAEIDGARALVGDRPGAAHDVQQRPADLFGRERGIEVQHHEIDVRTGAERAHDRQHVLAEGAADAAVGERDAGGPVGGPVADAAAQRAGGDVAQVVLDDGGPRALRDQRGDHPLGAGGVGSGEDDQIGAAGHAVYSK